MMKIPGYLAKQRDLHSFQGAGQVRSQTDASGLVRNEIWLYNAYASAIPVGQPCVVRYDGDEETNPYVISGVAVSGAVQVEQVVVPQVAVAASSFGWFCFEGYCSCLVDGTTDVAKDHLLCISVQKPGGLSRVGTGIIPVTASCAMARAAQTTNSAVATDIYLFGRLVSVAEDVS